MQHMNRWGIVVQARLGATRLPSKIKLMLTDTANVLEYQLSNLIKTDLPIIVAMPQNDEHISFSKSLNFGARVRFFFGDEDNVLKRYVDCADYFSLDIIVRICADNPFLNFAYLDTLIKGWSDDDDYSTYYNSEGVPAMKTHYGLFAEIVRTTVLKTIQNRTDSKYYREHVTPYIYEHPELFKINRLSMPEPFFSGLGLRLTLDTESDLMNIRSVIHNVKDTQNPFDIIAYCKKAGLLNKMEEQIEANRK